MGDDVNATPKTNEKFAVLLITHGISLRPILELLGILAKQLHALGNGMVRPSRTSCVLLNEAEVREKSKGNGAEFLRALGKPLRAALRPSERSVRSPLSYTALSFYRPSHSLSGG